MSAVASKSSSSAATAVAHKFGGTSLATPERMQHVANLLRARDDAVQVVVVSAMSGVTDALIRLAHLAAARDPSWSNACLDLERKHLEAARVLLDGHQGPTVAKLENDFAHLRDLLHALNLLGAPSKEALAYIQGLGEVFSATLLSAHFREIGEDCAFLDAREVLVVRHEELGAVVEWEESAARLAAWRSAHPARRVVATGFIARDAEGRATTLGRNGSDYSGAIFGALFDAAEVHIWTDVDGVLSADPRLVPEAVLVPELTYAEACELAYFGAKVIHPQTMQPAIARDIPLRIRNTFNPDHPGSRIAGNASKDPPVKGITAIGKLAMVSVEGAGMIGVPGTAERVFAALHRAGISVVMISQGSSEHSICCVVEETHAARAVEVLEDAFRRELDRGQIQRVTAEPGTSVLAVVGDGMAGTPGIAARLFDALARAGINVRAIAQGASERNISVAIASRQAARALRAVHAGFYLSALTISVGVVGPGHVGRALLGQLQAAAPRLRREANLDLRVRAIGDSKRLLLAEPAVELDGWKARLDASAEASDFGRLADHVHAEHLPHAVIVDCSASSLVADRYPEWLARGIHVITPNKQAGAGPHARFRAIREACAARGARFRYEATVGAGLPIITTLRDLIDTGDEVLAVEGILSGTLAWLFNRFDGTQPFSRLVEEARAAGYTEPDPRDDLSGTDVARKLVILAREMGVPLDLSDVKVESLVPEELQGATREQFLQHLPLLDAPMKLRHAAAASRGRVLRYVARLDHSGAATVGLTELPADHAFAHIRLTDNIVQFTTRRYRDNPLVVQGPGAGPEVTAAGVFADLLRVAQSLGARV
jgi:aspartokinase/homoserine dehydrogenase 1